MHLRYVVEVCSAVGVESYLCLYNMASPWNVLSFSTAFRFQFRLRLPHLLQGSLLPLHLPSLLFYGSKNSTSFQDHQVFFLTDAITRPEFSQKEIDFLLKLLSQLIQH